MTESSYRRVTTRRAISKLQQVFQPLFSMKLAADSHLDDVRDIYRRAAGEELVVEGLREGTNLVGEE